MSVMKKLLEINDELVRTVAELEQLRSDQKTLQEICSIGKGRIIELQAELRKACAERDEAVEHAERLQAELDATRKQLQDVCSAKPDLGVKRMSEPKLMQEILSAVDQEEMDDAPPKPKKPKKSVQKPAGQSDLIRDVSHYTEMAETDTPATDDAQPQPVQEVILSAYIVGDKVSPEALRIVWATEEWIEQSKFGIVHPMKDVMFLDQDRFTPEQFSLTLMLSK